jgi:hypothetical protein
MCHNNSGLVVWLLSKADSSRKHRLRALLYRVIIFKWTSRWDSICSCINLSCLISLHCPLLFSPLLEECSSFILPQMMVLRPSPLAILLVYHAPWRWEHEPRLSPNILSGIFEGAFKIGSSHRHMMTPSEAKRVVAKYIRKEMHLMTTRGRGLTQRGALMRLLLRAFILLYKYQQQGGY